ncbi:MAG TPA: endonuclease/exonuclease/phosphatase family protein [Bacteroidetes bacterium]|nr:endonuclease/exonuclease/phosphatase family protein [Bacteroidota bacterium]
MKKVLSHPVFHILVTGLILATVLVCVFPNAMPRLSWVINYAVQLMLFFLLAGLVMLFLGQPRLTFAFFGGCVLLVLFLKYSVKGDGIERWRNQVRQRHLASGHPVSDLKVAHINLTNANSRAEVAAILKTIRADILSLHEVTPGWAQWLADSLDTGHPFRHIMVDLGIFGVGVYSNYKLINVDTFFYKDIPNLMCQMEKDGSPFHLISVHTKPALDELSKNQLEEHLNRVQQKINNEKGAKLVAGDFNAVSWSGQLQSFLDHTGLMESRTGFLPGSFSGKISLFDVPLDHIFYSGEFVCTHFQNINGQSGQHLGILGTYRFPLQTNHVQ